MSNKNTLLVWLVAAVVLLSVVNVGYTISVNGKLKDIDPGVSEAELKAAIEGINIPDPAAVDLSGVETRLDSVESSIAGISIEDADNYLLNEFLEDKFAENFTAIEVAAEEFALEELEDDDYEVVVDYLITLLAAGEELDEDSVEVDIEDIEVEVTRLGLKEDEDKSARVTFEIEVEYELEEGVRDDFEKDLVVVYDVVFEEGDFDDEEVEFISIA